MTLAKPETAPAVAAACRRVEERASGSGIRVSDTPGLPAALTPTPASAGKPP